MKELEEVSCEIRRAVNLQYSISNRLKNLETEERGHSPISQEYNASNYRGGFLHNATYAWLSYDCHFVVFNVKIGENVSSWTFRDTVTCVSQFPTQAGELPLLLIGTDNNASKLKDSSGLLCIFDCATSHVLRAIRMPCGIEQVCIVSGGAEWEEFNDKRPDNILNEMDGIACVVLRNLQHIMIDLRRSTWDIHEFSVVMDEISPAEIELSVKQTIVKHHSNQERHTAYNLLNNRIERYIDFNRETFQSLPLSEEILTTTIISSTKIGCLISGCLGRVIIWQNDGSVGWISTPVDENMTVTHLALLEPTDDPRPFYYLWVVFEDETSKMPPLLRMYAMLFERKYCDRGMNLYFNLEADPSLKFEFELSEGDKVISLCTIERESNPEQTDSGTKRGEDNLLLVATNERIVLFDLNQWYKEQMPQTISECQNPNSIIATYSTRSNAQNSKIISFAYVPQTLQEFSSNNPISPEELFYPNSLSLEWVELSMTKLTFWMTRGIQMDLLREMAMTGPIILIQPSETFHRCLSVGLVPFNSEFSFASDQNAQREMLLSLCLEQRWSTFLVKCAVEWSDGSASYLYPTFLKWGIQRASTIKVIADRLCIPLFDQSGNSISEADVKTLRFCSQQFECLSNVVSKLPFETADLTTQRRTLKRISTYFQVLLWFYDVGLLPETQELEEGPMPISLALKVPYPYEKLSGLYKVRREQIQTNKEGRNENNEDLFIDELIMRECPMLKEQWERESGTIINGCYPPPSLQSLLRSYLTDCHQIESNEISCKHQITIYLLMDLAMLLQRLYPGVDQLIKYPSAFKMSPSLIKLTQAFWLLDHEDYQGFLNMMTGQLVSDSDIKDWHHKLVLRMLVRNNQHKLALVYLRVRKPPLSSTEEQSVALTLSVEHGLVQSAFHRKPPCHYEQLLTAFFQACKTYGKLNDILHLNLDSEEEEIFVKFLEKNKTEDLTLLYYLQRCRYMEAINGHPMIQYQSNFTKSIQSTSSTMLGAYNTTLPDVTKRFSMKVATNSDIDMEPRYPRPMSHCKSHDRLRDIHETVIMKARETYLRGEKCQIPFISTPCLSLKLNDYSANMNCVLFPALTRKYRSKRTLHQIYEDDSNENGTPDNVKRRKLSNGSSSPNKINTKESGLTANFETPLVERKSRTFTDTVPETPQSILKIRQLIRTSTSPTVADIPQTNGVTDGLTSEKEKKINRQIRFIISQSKKTLTYEDENEEDNSRVSDGDNSRLDIVGEENEVSLNSNMSNKSYNESAVLSGNSSLSKSYCCPRPRRSLRRSALQLSVESLQESSTNTKKVDNLVKSSISSSTDEISRLPEVTNISGRPSSLQSLYSTTILTSDSSIETSKLWKQSVPTTPQSPWKSSISNVKRDRQSKLAASSTPLSKIIALQACVKNKTNVSDEMDVARASCISDVHEPKENPNVPSEFEKFLSIEQSKSDINDFSELQHKLEENVQTENQDSTCSNKRTAEIDNSKLQSPYEDIPALFEYEKAAELNLISIDDEFDEELLRLQDDDEGDSDQHEEAFESLSTFENVSFHQAEDEICVSHSPIFCNPEDNVQEQINIIESNLYESQQIIAANLTDDESSKSRNTPIALHESDNEIEECFIPTIDDENMLYEMYNITDDESNSDIVEIKEPQMMHDKPSDLQVQDVVQDISMKEDNESRERVQESSEKVKSLEGDDCEISRFCDNDNNIADDSKKIHSSHEHSQKIKSTESQRDLPDNESSPKYDKSLLESKNEQSIRKTRSRKGSSIAEDTMADISSQHVETKRITRLRRASSMTKDIMIDSSSQNIGKSLRLRRAISMTKDIMIDSPSRNIGKSPRLRRASSMAKDILTNLRIDEDLKRVTSLESDNSANVQTPTKRGRKLTSSIKETPCNEIKDDDKELPVRRSTRRITASAKKKLLETSKTTTIPESTSSISKLINADEEGKNTKKRSSRVKKSSVSSDADKELIEGSTASSTMDLDNEEKLEIKATRKRGSSVPKEIDTVQTGRRRRANSIIKETIPEVSESTEESKKLKKFAKDVEEINSSAINTRSRRLSIQSMPEELEDILSQTSKETRSTTKAKQNIARQRRASSADVPHKEIKRRTRNIHATSIAVEPIVEESIENEDKIEHQEDKTVEDSGKVVQNVPARRRRATSTIEKKVTTTRKGRRRRTSEKQEVSNVFSFSQPEKTDDVSLDEQDIGEVPNYVFSPPHTRSRKTASNQHRRKVRPFIPNCKEEVQHTSGTLHKTNAIVEPDVRYARVTINTYGSRFRKKFLVAKKSKNTNS